MLPESNVDCSKNDSVDQNKKRPKPRENGGKYGYDDYPNSQTVVHDVVGYKPGDRCLACPDGKYYYGEDKKLLEFAGNPIITVTKHKKSTLRCNCCGHEIFSKKRIVKWTPEAKSSIAICKLFGTPLYRLARLQKMFGIPVAVSTLWQAYKEVHDDSAKFIVMELFRICPESKMLLTDDTGMRILEVIKDNKNLPTKEQRACHTTVMCFQHLQGKIILYISANRYCKENWLPLLNKRESNDKLIIVSDVSSQSFPTGKELDKAYPLNNPT